MNENSLCLNCGKTIAGKFCSNCGQKTDTYRITFKHLIFHDFIHGVWHIEKGILFTLKEALLRPGNAAVDYIGGKRIRYYNIFYLILIFVGLSIVVEDKLEALDKIYGTTEIIDKSKEELNAFIDLYAKIMLESLIPIFALFGFILFKRSKFNYSEHFIITGMIFLGVKIIYTATLPLMLFYYTKNFDIIAEIVDSVIFVALMPFIANGYYQAVGKNYSKFGFFLRIITFLSLIVTTMYLYVDIIMKILE